MSRLTGARPIDPVERLWSDHAAEPPSALLREAATRGVSCLALLDALVREGGAVFGDEALAAAIFERSLGLAHTMTFRGESASSKRECGRQLGRTGVSVEGTATGSP